MRGARTMGTGIMLGLLSLWMMACRPELREASLGIDTKIRPYDGAANDHFGASVAIDGELILVGATGDDDQGREAGGAYIFRRVKEAWKLEDKLEPVQGRAQAHFGLSTDVSGDWAIVSARGNVEGGRQSGTAYLFKRTDIGWLLRKQATVEHGRSNNQFGACVSIDGLRAVVGAPGDIGRERQTGAAHAYECVDDRWELDTKLVAARGSVRDEFGASVAIQGDRIAVGAPGDDEKARQAGSAYVFRRTSGGWREEARLIAEDGRANSLLGQAIAIDGDRVVVGAPGDPNRGKQAGAAYVYARTSKGWRLEGKLRAPDGGAIRFFGCAVSISGNRILVGSNGVDHKGPRTGAAYLFRRSGSGWALEAKLTAGDAREHDNFGSAVAISGSHLVVGAHGDDDAGTWSGSAYAY